MIPLKIVVLGGTGFVGRLLVKRLAAEGHQVVLLSRNLAAHHDRLLPQSVLLRELDVHDPVALGAAITGADVAINLIAILNEGGSDGSGFKRVHVELCQTLISACQQEGVRRLVQMSSLNAGRGDSHYLASRGQAEAAVKASRLDWTIFEPSVIFGVGDGLFERFGALLRTLPVLPLACPNSRMAPVYVGDVVEAISRCLRDERSIGEVYELYGPEVFSLKEIVRMTAAQSGLRRVVLPLPNFLGRIQGLACDLIPGKPFSSDNFRSLQLDSVGGIDGLHRLGIEPTRVAQVLPDILGNFEEKQTRFARYRAMH